MSTTWVLVIIAKKLKVECEKLQVDIEKNVLQKFGICRAIVAQAIPIIRVLFFFFYVFKCSFTGCTCKILQDFVNSLGWILKNNSRGCVLDV